MAASAGTIRAGRVVVPTRTLGAGLIVYGVVGLVLAAFLLLALGPLDLAGLGRIDTERQAVVELIAAGENTAADSRAAVERGASSVTAGAEAAEQSAEFTRQLASALRQLGDSLRVELFGSRPLESAAADVEEAAARADAAAVGLDRAATEARAGADGMTRLSSDLEAAAAQMTAVRAGLTGLGGTGSTLAWLRIVLIGLVLWLAIPAAVCVWLGIRFRAAATR